MKETRIELDLQRTRARFPGPMLGLINHRHEECQYLTGRMPADRMQAFIDQHRQILDEPADAGAEAAQIRRLTKRRAELMRQTSGAYSLPPDQLMTITPAEIGQDLQNKAGAAELVRQLDNAINDLTRQAHRRADRRDFARLVVRLADVSDDVERAQILDDAGILSDESRRRFLTGENLSSMPINQQGPELDPDRLTG